MQFSSSRYTKMRFAVGASLRTPMGKLTALPRAPSWFSWGAALLQVRGGEERGRKKGGIGERSPTSFLQFNHCGYLTLGRHLHTRAQRL